MIIVDKNLFLHELKSFPQMEHLNSLPLFQIKLVDKLADKLADKVVDKLVGSFANKADAVALCNSLLFAQ